ncbi:hypothetical protein Mp_7g17660 [Marchantia polymorpha subsp. ruderalis]|uniref:Kinesin motor domain-containing protein n=2 Tax=Marchantia polymorpha TaxID=3197 RepID=A0AAF6C0U5_MARPO|nr:hypothetical protein MARPO_0051s0102 [Marchantia polymorpha]BBN17879.1 hypothetical protein Mp_7g17660 [Marchantia polymorpha subsp. ruderalis]|eukprot:PTQ38502.1 hypothetical protein MARPO_0051s0102 [Marchantia polymorpha]
MTVPMSPSHEQAQAQAQTPPPPPLPIPPVSAPSPPSAPAPHSTLPPPVPTLPSAILPPSEDSAVRVAVRARPLIEKEIVEKCQECVSYSQDGRQIVLGKDRRFTFDYVFPPIVGQEDVYNDCVKPLVDSCIAGYNATVLAYGQTGSGKTHTMGCGNNTSLLEEELGILPRAIRQLYEAIEERTNQAEFLVKCAFVEIYNEEVKDLLHPDTPSKLISIREDANGDIILAGVKEEVVTNFESMIRFLEHGSVFRTTGSTLMNQQSSRSHAIFTIIVEQRAVQDGAPGTDCITAKFHLVDLAGSERAKRTGAVGLRFKESVTINCGLLALGNVISALGDERKRGHHVPYRESKLTRLLQDSLGGNSRTCMIACISTADTNFEETLNTLKYANRARNIHNKPIINRDPQAAQLNQLRHEVRALQVELLNTRMQSMGLEPVTGPQSLETLLQDESHRQFLDDIRSRADASSNVSNELLTVHRKSREREQECMKLKQDMKTSESLISKLQEEILELRTERDHYQLKLDEVNAEMVNLTRLLPEWENAGGISSSPREHLAEMTKRLAGEVDAEGNDSDQLCSPPNGHTERSPLVSVPQKLATDRESSVEERSMGVTSSHGRASSRGTRNVINQHLRSIRVLEEQLAVKESDVRARDEALMEAKDDLARDERIFAEKMKEIKSLKALARDLASEKQDLLIKLEHDAAIISNMSKEAMAKDDQLARLKISLEALVSGRSDGHIGSARSKADNDLRQYEDLPQVCESCEGGRGDIGDGADPVATPNVDTEKQKLEELAERMKAEEDEKERLLFEKIAIEEQKSRLEEDVRLQTREFKRSKQIMDKQLHELALSIQQKEELIQELARNEAEAKHLTLQYESRMLELEAEMRRKEEEVEALKKELDAIDKNAARGVEEKKKLREQYEEKVKRITSQLIALKKQRWEQESQRLERHKAKSEVKVQNLQHEITRMRAQQDSLKKKIKETTDMYEDEHERHLKSMAALKRDSEAQLKRVRELEKQRMVVRRKNEEMAAANKKLKELGLLEVDTSSKLSNRERSMAYDQAHKTARRGNTTAVLPLPDASSPALVSNVERTVTTLDQEIGKFLKVKEAVALKIKQEAKKEEILLEKDECLNERSKLELKHARAVHDIAQELEKRTLYIQDMETKVELLQTKAEEARVQGRTEIAQDLLQEVMSLRDQCQREKHECAMLEESRKPHKLMTKGEASLVGELDERIEALDAQAEYVTLSIAEQEKNIQDPASTLEQVQSQLENLGLQEAKVVLKKYLEKFVDIKDKQRQEAKLVANLELQLKEKTHALAEAESNSRLKELEFDRRLTELHSQHAKEVQYLLKQVETVSVTPIIERPNNPRAPNSSPEVQSEENYGVERREENVDNRENVDEHQYLETNQKLVALRKDNLQYKQTNSLLKRKLQEMISAWEAEKKVFENMVQNERHVWENERKAWDIRACTFLQQHEQLERQHDHLEKDHQALKDELENTKSLLHKAGLGIRLPVRNVRELTDGDVDMRSVPPSRGHS